MRGGYLLIDLKNENLLSLSSLDGIYERLEGNYGKPILLTGINISDVEKDDIYVMPEVSGSSYVLRNVYGYDVTIADDDSISVASTQWATKAYADSVADAKTIYCHPFALSSQEASTNKFRLTGLIFNDSSTALTISTFQQFLDALVEANPSARLMVSGALYATSQLKTIIASYLTKTGGNYYIVGVDAATGEPAALSDASFSAIFDNVQFNDGVNAIN